jgi:hypothetical protein
LNALPHCGRFPKADCPSRFGSLPPPVGGPSTYYYKIFFPPPVMCIHMYRRGSLLEKLGSTKTRPCSLPPSTSERTNRFITKQQQKQIANSKNKSTKDLERGRGTLQRKNRLQTSRGGGSTRVTSTWGCAALDQRKDRARRCTSMAELPDHLLTLSTLVDRADL